MRRPFIISSNCESLFFNNYNISRLNNYEVLYAPRKRKIFPKCKPYPRREFLGLSIFYNKSQPNLCKQQKFKKPLTNTVKQCII